MGCLKHNFLQVSGDAPVFKTAVRKVSETQNTVSATYNIARELRPPFSLILKKKSKAFSGKGKLILNYFLIIYIVSPYDFGKPR